MEPIHPKNKVFGTAHLAIEMLLLILAVFYQNFRFGFWANL